MMEEGIGNALRSLIEARWKDAVVSFVYESDTELMTDPIPVSSVTAPFKSEWFVWRDVPTYEACETGDDKCPGFMRLRVSGGMLDAEYDGADAALAEDVRAALGDMPLKRKTLSFSEWMQVVIWLGVLSAAFAAVCLLAEMATGRS